MTTKKQIPIGEGIFTWPSNDPRIIGSKCTECGSIIFPKANSCNNPNCKGKGRAKVEEVTLSKRGKLHSYTIERYQPPWPWKGPETMLPYGFGWVEMPEGVAVLSVFTTADPKELKIGRTMEFVVEKLYEDKDGNDVMNYKFKPV